MLFSPSNHAGIVRQICIKLLVASLCVPGTSIAQTEIHRCTDADGSIVFSQLPCPPQKPVEPEELVPDAGTEIAAPESTDYESPFIEAPQDPVRSEEDIAACQKPIRDAIDAIDAEIGREYTPEKADQYKQRLLELTRQLRQC